MIAMKNNTAGNIDEYIAGFPEDTRKILEEVRATIQKAVPKATEVISYQMPAFKLNGVLVYFAAYKNHIGFYPTSSPIKFFSEELKAFKTSKGAIQFPIDKPMPLKLISRIVKFRVSEDILKSTSKIKKK